MTTKKTHILKTLFFFLSWNLLVLPLIISCLSSDFIREASFTPGVYEGTGHGRRGPIRVRVQLSAAGIEDIVIVSHRESAYPGAAAMEELLEEILEAGSTDLDAISGATLSSRGFLEAVENALQKASAPK
jgi:fumarate reductase flavoprotein subunit